MASIMGSYTFLVTGASSAFGICIATRALKAGYKIVTTARNIDSAVQRYPELKEAGDQWVKLDVTDPSTQATVAQVAAQHDVNVLINCAGYGILGSLEDMRLASRGFALAFLLF